MKYKFKNAEVEKALRLVANELGVNNESFDKQIEEWGFNDVVYMDDGERDVLFFPTELVEKVEEFNPDGWNSSKVEPPKDRDECGTSPIMLVENYDGYPSKGFFVFAKKEWLELGTGDLIECSRYRLYPDD